MNLSAYKEIWDAFIHGDHISQAPVWGGETLALIVPVAAAQTLKGIEEIQSRLASALPFHALAPDVLHITIRLFGLPEAARAGQLSGHLRAVFASVQSFNIQFPRVNSFFRAPFYEVHDQGALAAIQAQIQPGCAALGFPEIDYGPRGQVYHLTLGAYTASNDGAAARRLLRELREFAVEPLWVDRLCLVRTSSGAPYRMDIMEEFPLR